MKLYVSESNYYPGATDIKAGTVFSEAQWIKCGGSATSLKEHVEKGYIKEAVQAAPPPPPQPTTPPPADKQKGAKPPVVPPVADTKPAEDTKPSGVWNFTKEELQPFGLPVLNTMLKDRAEEFDLKVEPFDDKDKLIEFMTSEA